MIRKLVAKIKSFVEEHRNAIVQALEDKDYDIVARLTEDECCESPYLF